MVRRFYSSKTKKKKFERWSLGLEKLPGWSKIGLVLLSFVTCFLLGSFLGLLFNRPTVGFLARFGKLPR